MTWTNRAETSKCGYQAQTQSFDKGTFIELQKCVLEFYFTLSHKSSGLQKWLVI
jgi:hypothetical protein